MITGPEGTGALLRDLWAEVEDEEGACGCSDEEEAEEAAASEIEEDSDLPEALVALLCIVLCSFVFFSVFNVFTGELDTLPTVGWFLRLANASLKVQGLLLRSLRTQFFNSLSS